MITIDESQVVSLLKTTEIFHRVKPEHAQPIARACRVVRFGAQSRIVRQGDAGGELFIVAAGSVAVVIEDLEAGTEQAVLKLGPGQSFGEVSLLIESARSATVKALDDTVCIALAKKSFDSILRQIPELGLEISRYLAARLHQQCQLTGFRFVSDSQLVYDPELHKLFSEGTLDRARAIPLNLSEGTLTVALTRPNDLELIQTLRRDVPGLALEPVACSWEDYESFRKKYRQKRAQLLPNLDSLEHQTPLTLASGEAVPTPLSALFLEMLQRGMSQVTVEVKESKATVFDSAALAPTPLLNIEQVGPVVAQLDALFLKGGSSPYLGSATLAVGEHFLKAEVSKLPALSGPRYSLKLVDPGSAVPPLKSLVPVPKMRETLLEILRDGVGAVMLAGAGRCGKTVAAYSILSNLASDQGVTNLISLEKEPLTVLASVSQVRRDNDWQALLEAAQAQSPALIYVDDISTAELPEFLDTCEAGNSLLFACTTNDPMSLIAGKNAQGADLNGLAAILHLQSVPRQCPHCRSEYQPPASVLDSLVHEKLADRDQLFFTCGGCSECRNSKILGRTHAFELLTLNPILKEMLEAGRPAPAIRKAAFESSHLIGFQATAKILLKQGDLSATDALRYFGGGA